MKLTKDENHDCVLFRSKKAAEKYKTELFLQKSTKGSIVLDHVFHHVNLVEIDYFGLRYCDRSHQTVSTVTLLNFSGYKFHSISGFS